MQQLKVFGISPGELKHLKMSTIVNVVTVVQVHIASYKRMVDPTNLTAADLLATHSAEYADTPLVQSGHRMVSAKITGGDRFTLSTLLDEWSRTGYAKSVERAKKLMQDSGVSPNARVLAGFDMEIDLAPAQDSK